MPRPKALVRPAAVVLLVAALAGLLIGGAFSETSGKPASRSSSHCANVPRGPAPARRSSLVIGLNSVWNNDCNLAAIASAGVSMERLEISWDVVEPRPGKWSFTKFDRQFAVAARHGITVLPLLMNVPGWAGPAWNAFPSNGGAYAAYVARVVARYGPHGSFWRGHRELPARPARWFEIWNEPYLSQFSAGGVDPAAYARLYRRAAMAGGRADPAARFLIQADLYTSTAGGHSGPWVGPMFKAVPDLARWFDGVAVHPYTSTDSPSSYTPDDPRGEFRRIDNIRQEFATHGAGSKPFWITEVGWSTCPGDPDSCVSDQKQAAFLAAMFNIVKSDYSSWVQAVFPYNYRDGDEDNVANKEAWFGLIRRAGSPKPAWNVLRQAASS
jgi:polysaccharide biosynthesis protein PslG